MKPSSKHFIETRNGPWETWDEKRDIQVKVKKDGGTVKVYFQGSGSTQDWMINFDFPIKPYKNMKYGLWFAHGGFVKSYKSIRSRLLETVEGFEKIEISGYSQGAAYAILACEDFAFLEKNVEVIAYAPPRVFFWWGFWTLEKRMKGKLTLVKNYGDIVTHLPFVTLGFKHIGKKVKVGRWLYEILPLPKFHLPKKYIASLSKL